MLGGFDCFSNHRDVNLLDVGAAEWNRGFRQDQVGIFGAYHASCPLDDGSERVLVFGGMRCVGGPYEFSGRTHLYDVQTQQCEELQACGAAPTPRAQSFAHVEHGQFFVIGGLGVTGAGAARGVQQLPGDVYSLDLETRVWTKLDASGCPPPSLTAPSCCGDFCLRSCRPTGGKVSAGKLALVSENGADLQLYTLDLTGAKGPAVWGRPPMVHIPWRGNSAAVVQEDRVLIVGGHPHGSQATYNTPHIDEDLMTGEPLAPGEMPVVSLRSRLPWSKERLLWMGAHWRPDGTRLNPACPLDLPEVLGHVLRFFCGPVTELDFESVPDASTDADYRGFWR